MEIKERWERLWNQVVNLETSSIVFGRWKIKANKALNRRSEIFAKCRHAEKFHAGKFESVRDKRTHASANR
jgi:hypothetical protein